MAAINISADRNLSGKLQGSYVPVAEGVNFIGTIAHGNKITITDSLARFGARSNPKPLVVLMGDAKTGSSLGRDTSDYSNAASSYVTSVKNGSLAGSIRHDFKSPASNTGSIWGGGSFVVDGSKPVITYVERYYAFDITNPQHQSNTFDKASAWVNGATYTITIEGQTATFVADASPTDAEFQTSMIAQINAFAGLSVPLTASVNDGGIKILPNVAGTPIFVTCSANLKSSSNLKTNRIWASPSNTPTNSSSYIGYNGAEGAGSSRHVIENVDSVSHYYSAGVPANQWLSETFVFNNSSASGVPDGYFEHWRSNTFLNAGKSTMITFNNTGFPNKLRQFFLDEWSNGAGRGLANAYGYLGYMCIDDEWNQIYLGDSATKSACTKFIPQPQSFWTSNRVDIKLVQAGLPLSGAHVYVCTAKDTFVYLGQLPA